MAFAVVRFLPSASDCRRNVWAMEAWICSNKFIDQGPKATKWKQKEVCADLVKPNA